MAWSFENAKKWSRFEELNSHLWHTQNLGDAEWRDMNALIGLSDWSSHILEADRYNARKMLEHARQAMARSTGYDPNTF